VTSSWLGVDEDLLIARLEFSLDDSGGHLTHLTVGPVEGYTPDPGSVKIRKAKGKGSKSGVNWSGAGGT
jgi:prophage tail gpP-like protein